MRRTSIMLPRELKSKAQLLASKKGISLGELIRESLKNCLKEAVKGKVSDSFYDDDQYYKGEVPKDLSSNHDEYLSRDLH